MTALSSYFRFLLRWDDPDPISLNPSFCSPPAPSAALALRVPPPAASRCATADCDPSLLPRPSPACGNQGRHKPTAGSFPHGILHQPVFERVEADHHQPSSGLQQPRRGLEQRLRSPPAHHSHEFGSPERSWSPDAIAPVSSPGRQPIRSGQVAAVVVIGRALTMALAILRDLLSSPNS